MLSLPHIRAKYLVLTTKKYNQCHIYIHIYVYRHIHLYICIYVCTYIHIYIHICICNYPLNEVKNRDFSFLYKKEIKLLNDQYSFVHG